MSLYVRGIHTTCIRKHNIQTNEAIDINPNLIILICKLFN